MTIIQPLSNQLGYVFTGQMDFGGGRVLIGLLGFNYSKATSKASTHLCITLLHNQRLRTQTQRNMDMEAA